MRTVTLVDDESTVLDVLTRAARSWNYECQAARSAEQAIELLENRLTPIVVTDLRMPGKGGVWLVHEIQRRWPEVAVIVVTAGEDESLVKCLAGGTQRYFLKPIQFDELQHALESTLQSYQQSRQDEHYRDQLEVCLVAKTRRLRRIFLSAIDSLARLMEARDAYIAGHSLRVRKYALDLAHELGLPRRQRRALALAARLHDIGKVGLPEAILNKPSELTEAEFATVKEHPVLGERILAPVVRNKSILSAIRGHHERFDGGGYPDGLRGEEIPLLARILSIADCFDALTSSRAYRVAVSVPEALAELRASAGTQFDPHLVRQFESIHRRPM